MTRMLVLAILLTLAGCGGSNFSIPQTLLVYPGCNGRIDIVGGVGFGGAVSGDYHVSCTIPATAPAAAKIMVQ